MFSFGEIVEVVVGHWKADKAPVWVRAYYKLPYNDKHIVSIDADAPDRMVSIVRKLKMKTLVYNKSSDRLEVIIATKAEEAEISRIMGSPIADKYYYKHVEAT